MLIPDLNPKDYDYLLPTDKIAFYPKENRGESKLLIADLKNQEINHTNFNNILDFLPSDSLIIFNETKVIPARIYMYKESKGKIEVLLSEPIYPSSDPMQTLNSRNICKWNCIIGGKLKENDRLFFQNEEIQFSAFVLSKIGNLAVLEFSWEISELTFGELLLKIGGVPLPPYIKRPPNHKDIESYQTVYAKNDGSVAAPTAGLHFTESIINKLADKNIEKVNLTLHVGLGTFKPISSNKISDHQMHSEKINILKIELLKIYRYLEQNQDSISNIISVGTTATRTLESLYWYGVKLKTKGTDLKFSELINNNICNQWDPYNLPTSISLLESIEIILNSLENNNLDSLKGTTSLIILPSYQWKFVNNLITNFHAPESTLLLLVASFLGKSFYHRVYQEALDNQYRFLSYGDSSLLKR